MPVLTISAVNTGTNQLTITGHGQVTGAGPAAVRHIAGALPAPLAAVTDYWLIVDDANTVRLATSSANATAGTAIDITTSGSGTLVLEIGIPYRRARTYTALSQVRSADLNAKMDALIALHAWFTGQPQSVWKFEPTVWEEQWRINTSASATNTSTTDGSTDPEGWTKTGTGATRRYCQPTSTFHNRHVELVWGGTDNITLASERVFFTHADLVFAAEWAVETGTVLGGGATTSGGVEGALGGGLYFVSVGSGNWQTLIGGASNVDTGVAVASNTVVRFRIEILGDNQHAGSNYLVRWYINGALVRETTTGTLGTDAYRFIFAASSTSGTPYQLRIGRLRAEWNGL